MRPRASQRRQRSGMSLGLRAYSILRGMGGLQEVMKWTNSSFEAICIRGLFCFSSPTVDVALR